MMTLSILPLAWVMACCRPLGLPATHGTGVDRDGAHGLPRPRVRRQGPITGRQNYLQGETRRTRRDAEADVERLLAHVEADRRPGPARDRRGLLDRWTEVVDHELSTASTTAGYVRRTIRPALSDMPLRKLQHRVDILDRLYTHLRRCNRLCDSSPARKAVDKAAADGPHVCRPMSPGAVRRVHAILSAPLNYAVSWGWIERNPADYAHRPKLARRRALPPRPEQVAELLNAAAAADEELAMFLWLAVTSGARRGELVALRWTDVAFDRGLLRFATNYVVRGGQRRLKGTKTDDERWLSVDAFTVQVLETLRSARAAALVPSGLPLPVDAFVFSPDPLGQRPWHPDHFTHAHSAARSGSAGPWRRPRRPAGRRGSPRRRRGRRRTGRTRARSSGC